MAQATHGETAELRQQITCVRRRIAAYMIIAMMISVIAAIVQSR